MLAEWESEDGGSFKMLANSGPKTTCLSPVLPGSKQGDRFDYWPHETTTAGGLLIDVSLIISINRTYLQTAFEGLKSGRIYFD